MFKFPNLEIKNAAKNFSTFTLNNRDLDVSFYMPSCPGKLTPPA
jgi:hypothetical protein